MHTVTVTCNVVIASSPFLMFSLGKPELKIIPSDGTII